jgi:nucleoside 2-deoxyribosyltransferase
VRQVRVYLAGPEVFLPNARAQLDLKIRLTQAAGLIPVSPGDFAVPPQPSKRQFGHAISEIDERMMDSADAIIANLTPYRGISADTGTCYELGYMCGQNKAAFAYSNVGMGHKNRIVGHYNGDVAVDEAGRLRGADGLAVEDVDMIDNLMMHGGVERRGGVVLARDVPAGSMYTDTSVFEEILAVAAVKLLG